MNQPSFLNALAADYSFEQIYNEAIPNTDTFNLINRAVWYALHCLLPGSNISSDGVDGGACYHIIVSGEAAQLYVLKVSTNATILRVRLLPPADPIEHIVWMHANHQPTITTLARVFDYCTIQIHDFLHTASRLEQHYPACPPLSAGWDPIFRWQRLYEPTMTNTALGDLIGADEQTVKNMRHKYGYQKRAARKTRKK